MEYNSESSLRSFVSLLSTAQTSLKVETMQTSHQLQKLFAMDKLTEDLGPCCSLPCLKLLHDSSRTEGNHPSDSNNKRRGLQESCAEKMAAPCHFTYNTLSDAPKVLIDNVSDSFKYLVKSRLASSINAFVSKSSASPIQKKMFVKSLTQPAITPVELETVVTRFQPILNSPLQSDKEKPNTNNSHGCMMMFSITMDVLIMGETPFVVRLEVPGHCSDLADSCPEDHLLKNVRLVFDTDLLLQQMITQARCVAKKALEIAADSAQSYIASLCLSTSSLVSLDEWEGSELSQLSDSTAQSQRTINGVTMSPSQRRRKLNAKK